MVFKHFAIRVLIRVLLLLGNMMALSYIVIGLSWLFTPLILGLLLLFQVFELVRFVNRTNQELTKLFFAIRHNDFSIGFSHRDLGKSFSGLSEEFGEVIRVFRENRIEKEAQYHYFKILAEQLHVGIVSMDREGSIELMNRAAEELLGFPNPGNWERMSRRAAAFTTSVDRLPSGASELVEWNEDGEERHFSVQVNDILTRGNKSRIITFQSIRSELELREIQAWHKLIRILTHEIMNSVTPIASLTETLVMLLAEPEGEEEKEETLPDEKLADMRMALNTIHKRSVGLLHFVSDYRKLTKVPVPQLESVKLQELIQRVVQLYTPELESQGIMLDVQPIPPHLLVEADTRLIEQVLINLIINAKDALENQPDPMIRISAVRSENRIRVAIEDNGIGISPEQLDKIFVPFYSTKKEGSGIGLSLSRHILKLHRGTIRVRSVAEEGSTFYLLFPVV